MKLDVLVTEELGKIPVDINVITNWGSVLILTGNGSVEGKHMRLEGSQPAFIGWLGKFKGVWLGEGSPQLQQFSVYHIKDELVPEKE